LCGEKGGGNLKNQRGVERVENHNRTIKVNKAKVRGGTRAKLYRERAQGRERGRSGLQGGRLAGR